MTRKDKVRGSTASKKVAGDTLELDKSTMTMLKIKPDAVALTNVDRTLLAHIHETCDLTDCTPMNNRYGPLSGISIGQRIIRAYRLGLLPPRLLCKPEP